MLFIQKYLFLKLLRLGVNMFTFKEILNRAKAFTLRKCKIFFKKNTIFKCFIFCNFKIISNLIFISKAVFNTSYLQ